MSNEGKACDAALRLLEEREEARRGRIRFPEKDHIGSPVELRVQIGAHEYAIEHTLIEAFPGQIAADQRFATLIDPIVKELSGQLPKPGVYYVYFPIDTRVALSKAKLVELRVGLTEWIRSNAATLHAEQPERRSRNHQPRGHVGVRKGTPTGLPFEVTLRRQVHWNDSGRHDGFLIPARFSPDDVEKLRLNRLAVALDKKCPKLKRCKQDGARSILVLEDTDISLSNQWVIGDALQAVARGRSDMPDEIFLLAAVAEPWTLWTLWRDGVFWPDEGYRDFNSSDLTDCTASGNATMT